MDSRALLYLLFWIACLVLAQCVAALGVALSARVRGGFARWVLLGVFVLPILGVASTVTVLAFFAYHYAGFAADWRGYTAVGIGAFLASAFVIAGHGWRRVGDRAGETPTRTAASWRAKRILGIAVLAGLLAIVAYVLADHAQQARLREIVASQRAILERDLESTLRRGPNVLDRYQVATAPFDELFEYGTQLEDARAALARKDKLVSVLDSARPTAALEDAVIAPPLGTGELAESDCTALLKLESLFLAVAEEAAYAGDLEAVLREREAARGLARQMATSRSLFRAVALPRHLEHVRELLEILLAHSSSPNRVVAGWKALEVDERELLEGFGSHSALENAQLALCSSTMLLNELSDADEGNLGFDAISGTALSASLRLWRFIGGVQEVERLTVAGAEEPALRTWELAHRSLLEKRPRTIPGDGYLAIPLRRERFFLLHRIGHALASQAVTRAALATVAYHLEENRYPARLEDLVPDYLQRVPEDPFRPGEPLRVAPTDAGLVIYSVGSSRMADGGGVDLDDLLTPRASGAIAFALGDAYTRRYEERDADRQQGLEEAARAARSEESSIDEENSDDADPDDADPDDADPDDEDP